MPNLNHYKHYKHKKIFKNTCFCRICRTKALNFRSLFIALALGVGILATFVTASARAQTQVYTVESWWPVDDALVQGIHPFKGMTAGLNVEQYDLFWQVDGGGLNPMPSNYEGYPHKETLVDVSAWNWRGAGPYTITYKAFYPDGRLISESSFAIYTAPVIADSAPTTSDTLTPESTAEPTTTKADPAPQPEVAPIEPVIVEVEPPIQTEPIIQTVLYIDPNSPAKTQANTWRKSRPKDAALLDIIAAQPQARWFGDWNADVKSEVDSYVTAATKAKSTPILVAYNIPNRDCGSFSAGGSNSKKSYLNWIGSLADGINNRSAIVILEPDALAAIDCLSQAEQTSRIDMLSQAIVILKTKGATVYIDAGHARWISKPDIINRLKTAGVNFADGFALNVSNFIPTAESAAYGTEIAKAVGKPFIIDTSRNGQGTNGEWCNPTGRGLGITPTLDTNDNYIAGYLWIKTPGESDGNCNGGPNAGWWWADYALGLAKRAAF